MLRAAGLIVLVAALLEVGSTNATIRPYDQEIAKELTLRLDDFDVGWKVLHSGTTRFQRTTCPGAPKIQIAITGFGESPDFSEIDTSNEGQTVTRIFPSTSLATRWFRWAGGAGAAACLESGEVDSWRHDGYKVTGISRARESFPVNPDCGYIGGYGQVRCFDTLKAWRLQYTATKNGSSSDIYYDYVVVSYKHAVMAFHFWAFDYSVTQAQSLVEAVLGRVQVYWWAK